jgi:hypothetical protein
MVRIFLACCVFTALAILAGAQTTIYGTNNYIEYQVGTLPLIISVSHGGSLEPASIPNRNCNNPVYATDLFTIETTLAIRDRLLELTGCAPHLIISHLKRSKLDPNRNLTNGACGHPEAMLAWQEFHDFITMARQAAGQQYDEQAFFIDLHGHGNPLQRIELGYLLYDDELELPDDTLNTQQYIDYSSVRNLALSNAFNASHAQLLRGPNAFGTLLADRQYPAVPSQAIPFPGIGSNYFSGGYITANHTGYTPGIYISGFQMELNFSNIRDTPASRTAFANAFAEAFLAFMYTHFTMNWQACEPLSRNEDSRVAFPRVFPNPLPRGHVLTLEIPDNYRYSYSLVDVMGRPMLGGQAQEGPLELSLAAWPSGVYVLIFRAFDQGATYVEKIILKD